MSRKRTIEMVYDDDGEEDGHSVVGIKSNCRFAERGKKFLI